MLAERNLSRGIHIEAREVIHMYRMTTKRQTGPGDGHSMLQACHRYAPDSCISHGLSLRSSYLELRSSHINTLSSDPRNALTPTLGFSHCSPESHLSHLLELCDFPRSAELRNVTFMCLHMPGNATVPRLSRSGNIAFRGSAGTP